MVAIGMTEVDTDRASQEGFTYLFKLVLLGDAETGKTASIARFTQDSFSPTYMTTIGVDFATKTVQMGGQLVKLQIWDTAGQERFRKVTNAYFRGAHGVFIFFDLTNRNSFDRVQQWKTDVENYAAKDAELLLISAKSDEEEKRQVTTQEVEELSKRLGLEYFDVSSKTGAGIHRMYERMVEKLVRTKPDDAENAPVGSTMAGAFKTRGDASQKKSKTCSIL